MNASEVRNYSWGDFNFSQRDIQVLDTSLRDGAQDAQLRHPTLAEKERFIDSLVKIGIDAVDIAIPVARGRHFDDALKLAKRLPKTIDIVCLARTQEIDIKAALDLAQGVGREVEVIVFLGSSPIRRWVEDWGIDQMTKWMEKSVYMASKEGLKPTIATEHTTESEPEIIKQLYRAGLENGGQKVCLADTTGAATPISTFNLINYFKEEVLKGFADIDIDWHGHDDRGLSVINSLTALASGAKRVHTTALGIGERAGNTPMEQILINLKIANDPKRQNLLSLPEFTYFASKIFNTSIRVNYPGLGSKVSMTASGIHAAAMRKARLLGIEPGAPYSIVNPEWFGKKSGVRIGPLSGESNVLEVAERLGIDATHELIKRVLYTAKGLNKILSDQDVKNIADSLKSERGFDFNGH